MNVSHFVGQLSENELVLWLGQPEKEAFQREEARINQFVSWYVLAWSVAFATNELWQHGLSRFHSYKLLSLVFAGPLFAIILKLCFRFGKSSAERYWYAVTNKRVLVEFPDEGSQSVLSLHLCDVKSITLSLTEVGLGSIKIVPCNHSCQPLSFRHTLSFRHIKNAEQVYEILNQNIP